MTHKVIDLFCGCGGISWGFKQEGFEIILGADINKPALKTYKRNFPDAVALDADLSTVSPIELMEMANIRPGELDVLVGGPPCQGFSKNVPAALRSHDDVRNKLILRYLEYVRILKPRVVLMENVAEMASAYEDSYTNQIYSALADLGYEVQHKRLLAAEYGVPQLRRRAFFFANRLDAPITFPEPLYYNPKTEDAKLLKCRPFVSVWDALSDLPTLENGEGEEAIEYSKNATTDYQKLMRKKTRTLVDHVARNLKPKQYARVRALKPGEGGGCDDLPAHLQPKSGFSGAYARLFPNEPARTITRWVFHPGSGRYFHPYDYRLITIREAARLQSFPDNFVFEGTYIHKAHQIGEAVPPLLAQAFARKAKEMLSYEVAVSAMNSSSDLLVQSSSKR